MEHRFFDFQCFRQFSKKRSVNSKGKRNKPPREKNVNANITSLMSFYFCRENLPKDKFMLAKLVSNEGWIPGKLFCEQFPKIMALKVTPEVLQEALQKSSVVQSGIHNDEISFRPKGIEISTPAQAREYIAAVFDAKKDLKSIPIYSHNSVVKTLASSKTIEDRMRKLLVEARSAHRSFSYYVIALDVEYATVNQGEGQLPALISICTKSTLKEGKNRTWLIWLDKLKHRGLHLNKLPPSLLEVLSDPRILKIGSSVWRDGRALCDAWEQSSRQASSSSSCSSCSSSTSTSDPFLSIKGMLELVHLFKSESPSGNSLEALCMSVLNQRMIKKKTTKEKSKQSHWRAAQMTDLMRSYASDDVAASLEIYEALVKDLSSEELEDIVCRRASSADAYISDRFGGERGLGVVKATKSNSSDSFIRDNVVVEVT
jgi:hypothetical protein